MRMQTQVLPAVHAAQLEPTLKLWSEQDWWCHRLIPCATDIRLREHDQTQEVVVTFWTVVLAHEPPF